MEDTHIRLEDLDADAKELFLTELKDNKTEISRRFLAYQKIAALTQLSEDTVQMTKVCISEISRYVSRLTRNTLSQDTQIKLYKFGAVDTLSCLQDIMWNISNIAQIQGISLETLAHKNMQKIKEIYPNPKTRTPLTTANHSIL